jgi:hypothetical protein
MLDITRKDETLENIRLIHGQLSESRWSGRADDHVTRLSDQLMKMATAQTFREQVAYFRKEEALEVLEILQAVCVSSLLIPP